MSRIRGSGDVCKFKVLDAVGPQLPLSPVKPVDAAFLLIDIVGE